LIRIGILGLIRRFPFLALAALIVAVLILWLLPF